METLEDSSESQALEQRGPPALVVLWHGGQPCLLPLPLTDGALEVGRERLEPLLGTDAQLSRRHFRVEIDSTRWRVRDFGSRNGTFLDSVRIEGEVGCAQPTILRAGGTLFLFALDMTRFEGRSISVDHDGYVIGPMLAAVWDEIRRIAISNDVLHVVGETGVGKERAARHYHDSGARRGGPFVAVNCAAIPPGLAERLLFGAKKGAYSGAERDVDGYLQTAHGGTLFLDEIGELSLEVQSKLLRVIETREVLPLGAVRGRRVDVGIVSATHANLQESVARRTFREDLFFRIARPVVRIPPLRERREEIPSIINVVLRTPPSVKARASLIEAALCRGWPGNIRELIAEIRNAKSRASGRAEIAASHLASTAGTVGMVAPVRPAPTRDVGAAAEPPPLEWRGIPAERIRSVLKSERGNVSAAARALGLHRNQLVRLMTRFSIR